jgi:hypothetical protein
VLLGRGAKSTNDCSSSERYPYVEGDEIPSSMIDAFGIKGVGFEARFSHLLHNCRRIVGIFHPPRVPRRAH